ncbi:hypothetical protein BU24DRAFT_448231 [Aaosphaeria arxii CBS 175.79]|uniref:Uncharacterized protein n=1 Tax=Aaosphaeria arxii CBS 175.79 TaxID=1450172 RepID=A0A6A5Y5K0_9PLEO|nr:uncharacterized protein BU24DRAFT_448231 [Aaosphaeria arxii CBS 175.79]KAF2019824.1 hypothetical protein BU24DRAFT_448231 [Aaosphaeria arxii CBS 175.79]
MELTLLLMVISNFVLSALSITNLGLISSMVGFLHGQKNHVHNYQVNWPGQPSSQLFVEPKNLWVDQGHTSNGAAGYGFFLGLYGLFVAWWLRRRQSTVHFDILSNTGHHTYSKQSQSRVLLSLVILQFLAVLFTLSALIFTFVVTNQTQGQSILPSVARPDVPYPDHWWTPETWFKAVLDTPLASQGHRNSISSAVTHMVAWRWILIPIFLTDIVVFGISSWVLLKQRKGARHTLVPEYIQDK